MRGWYIDSLDASGGIAFASWRERETDYEYVEAASTAHIAPPYFVAEPIVDRATALAATRGSFQAGFYVGGAEYRFESLAEVADFVRRLYGGASGGSGGGGALPPLPPAPDRPLGERRGWGVLPDSESASAADALHSAFEQFVGEVQYGSHSARFVEVRPMNWNLAASFADRSSSSRPLVRAGCDLTEELLARLPRSRDVAAAQWLHTWYELLHVLARMGTLGDIIPRIQKLSSFASDIDLFDDWRLYEYHELHSSPYDVLRSLPLPLWLSRHLSRVAKGNIETVANLLAAMMANPALALQTDSRAVSELCFFGAAAIVGADTALCPPAPYHPLYGRNILRTALRYSDTALSAMNALTREALIWCERALPRFAFDGEVESEIAKGPSLRYAAGAG